MSNLDSLTAKLNQLCDQEPYFIAWYLRDLISGGTAGRNSEVVTRSMSTRKISVMMTALREISNGTLSLEEKLLIDDHLKDNNSGCFQHFTGDFPINVHNAIVMMIVVSDNACTGAIIERLGGLDVVNKFCQSIGMTGTTHRLPLGRRTSITLKGPIPLEETNVTTATDVGHLLDLLVQGSQEDQSALEVLGVSAELCQLAIQIMKWQRLNDRMPLLLPYDVTIAHKTGRDFKDAGIIFKNDEPLFILTVYTDEVPHTLPDGMPGHSSASKVISSIARMCYDHLSDDPVKIFPV